MFFNLLIFEFGIKKFCNFVRIKRDGVPDGGLFVATDFSASTYKNT